jgi:hypothetical protein
MIRADGAVESVEAMMQLEIQKEEIEEQLQSCKDKKLQDELEKQRDAIDEKLLDLEMDNFTDSNGSNDDFVDFFDGGKFGMNDCESDTDDEAPESKKARLNSIDDDDTASVPPNFVVEKNDKVKFQTIEMSKGDLLYLPAGWFHEVSSHGGLHIAFNYWMHPPDVGDVMTFDKPYLSQFWQRDWDSRDESNL